MANSPKSKGGKPAADSGGKNAPKPAEGDSKKQRWYRDRRKLVAVAAALVVVMAVGVAVAYNQLKRPDDVSNPSVPFKSEPPPKPVLKTTDWPVFGYDRARTRYLPAKGIRPPFRRIWKYGGASTRAIGAGDGDNSPLIEFPPIFVRSKELCDRRTKQGCGGRLFFVDNDGYAISLDANTGRVYWRRHLATKNASSPAYAHGRLLITNLEPGQVSALDPRNGKTIWQRSLPGRSESSPLVIGNTVYFGCENGQLFAVSARTGKTKWATTLGGAVKAAPAYDKGILFVGDYGGVMSAVRAKDGKIVWQENGLGSSFGRSGAFYATPAVAFGRVYSGNNDSRVYSFDETTGEIAWTYSTGGYVYSGTAVADTPSTPPTVYVGSFDNSIYAIDAKTGDLRWQESAGGPVIGSLSIVGNVVYVATFDPTTTTGFNPANGKKVFTYPTGAYMPVISDGRRLYLTGYSSISALQPLKKGRKTGAKAAQGEGAKQRAGHRGTGASAQG